MVSFVENPEHFDSLPMVLHMETQLQQCVALQVKLASLDRQLALDPRYVHKVSHDVAWAMGSKGGWTLCNNAF